MTDPAKTGDLLTEFFGRSVVALELAAESSEFMSSIAAIALAIERSLRAVWQVDNCRKRWQRRRCAALGGGISFAISGRPTAVAGPRLDH